MSQEKVIAEWAAKHGLDREQFMDIYRSDAIREKVARARQMTLDYMIEGTPSLVVDGKFLTTTSMAGSIAGAIPLLDRLINLARQQRAEKTK
jgi:thiol:disulfide interchange protein DsbA